MEQEKRIEMIKVPITVFSVFLLVLLHSAYTFGGNADAPVVFSLSDVSRQSVNFRERQANCGPLALARCLAISGQNVPFAEIYAGFTTKTAAGVSLSDLLERTQYYFPNAVAVTVKDRNWRTLPRPAIIILREQGHVLVFEGFDADNQKILLWDPDILGYADHTLEAINDKWRGEVILLSGLPRVWTTGNLIMLVISALCMICAVYWMFQSFQRRST